MVKLDKKTWKENFFAKLQGFVKTFSKCLIIGVDNVRSKQMQGIRAMLRGRAELLMGKNTMIRKCLRDMVEEFPYLEELLPFIVGNIGFCFTDMDLQECRDALLEHKVQAPAKAGVTAPLDVFLEAGPTGQGPEKTSFFQALNLQTKIAKGSIELLSKVHLIKTGDKVGLSEARLLNMLNISPFFYGVTMIYVMENGSCYPPEVLDIKPEVLLGKVMQGIQKIASVSLAIGFPTTASVPHSIINGMKNVVAVALAADLDFGKEHAGLANAKAYLADPEAFAAAMASSAPAAGGGGGASSGGDAPAAAAPPPAEEESDEEMGMGLFD
eukprot:m.331268 g.331268  ORF g.331268 m.331268 type:complete len:326 (-) comp16687_c0_seq1:48-1025(-)